ncbi:unnamed protein product [Ambrosiozyma monospora]|uniref:Unnamed protein product n=1 Tax=Ambrosiozyma monospora TaxID=43982 RepID=A0A9W6Z559_AMBMO|nr:unnamed protein product [Ambrosiozyma monospora]
MVKLKGRLSSYSGTLGFEHKQKNVDVVPEETKLLIRTRSGNPKQTGDTISKHIEKKKRVTQTEFLRKKKEMNYRFETLTVSVVDLGTLGTLEDHHNTLFKTASHLFTLSFNSLNLR